ncbi:uncharacterized protein LOC143885370 [Tasmannia lanceolata]|uniref:uncharacterized protein LOC143885370 n=1 Tax=Tasmannia lanceolata TaxID=3420 RepID=UPI004063E860
MEEETYPSSISSLYKNNTTNSSAIRFLGFLKQPDSDPNPNLNSLELDESDVVWSASDSSDSPTLTPNSLPQSSVSNSNSPSNRRNPAGFRADKFGLSAALSDDPHPLIQRNPSFNPSFSATTAARTIPPPVPRSSGSSFDDFSAPSSGKFHQSAPVNVPIWSKGNSEGAKLEFFEEDDEFEDEEMLPPHEIVARSHMTTFSVFEGVGRTLKGRDLRRVRNAVWQKTGFLD